MQTISDNNNFSDDNMVLEGFEKCLICLQMVSCVPLNTCAHHLCHPCLKELCEFQVSNHSHQIICPDPQCKIPLSPNMIDTILPPNLKMLKTKLEVKSFMKSGMLESTDMWVECPYDSCHNCFLYQQECVMNKSEKCEVACSACAQTFCLNCSLPPHLHAENVYCPKLDEKVDLKKWEIDAKFCPKCIACVEKVLGCDHVKCPNCNHEFCWLCGDPFQKDHHKIKHWETLDGSLIPQLTPLDTAVIRLEFNNVRILAAGALISPYPIIWVNTQLLMRQRVDVSLIVDPEERNNKIYIVPKGISKTDTPLGITTKSVTFKNLKLSDRNVLNTGFADVKKFRLMFTLGKQMKFTPAFTISDQPNLNIPAATKN